MNASLIARAVARVCGGYTVLHPMMGLHAFRGAGGKLRMLRRG